MTGASLKANARPNHCHFLNNIAKTELDLKEMFLLGAKGAICQHSLEAARFLMHGMAQARLFTLHYCFRQRQGDPQREHPQQHPLDWGSAVLLLSITLGLLIDSQ